MSWAEIKKSINSNISKSLDVLITEKSNEILNKILTSDVDSGERIVNLLNDSSYLDTIISSTAKCNAVLNNPFTFDVILSSDTAISKFGNSPTAMNALCSNRAAFKKIIETRRFRTLLDYSTFRNAMFNNSDITEELIRSSEISKNIIATHGSVVNTSVDINLGYNDTSGNNVKIFTDKSMILSLSLNGTYFYYTTNHGDMNYNGSGIIDGISYSSRNIYLFTNETKVELKEVGKSTVSISYLPI